MFWCEIIKDKNEPIFEGPDRVDRQKVKKFKKQNSLVFAGFEKWERLRWKSKEVAELETWFVVFGIRNVFFIDISSSISEA